MAVAVEAAAVRAAVKITAEWKTINAAWTSNAAAARIGVVKKRSQRGAGGAADAAAAG